METRGLNVQQLANRAGVTRAAAVKWIEINDIRVSTVEKIAAALGVEPWELLKPSAEDDLRQGNLQHDQREQAPNIVCPHCGKVIYLTATTEEYNAPTTDE